MGSLRAPHFQPSQGHLLFIFLSSPLGIAQALFYLEWPACLLLHPVLLDQLKVFFLRSLLPPPRQRHPSWPSSPGCSEGVSALLTSLCFSTRAGAPGQRRADLIPYAPASTWSFTYWAPISGCWTNWHLKYQSFFSWLCGIAAGKGRRLIGFLTVRDLLVAFWRPVNNLPMRQNCCCHGFSHPWGVLRWMLMEEHSRLAKAFSGHFNREKVVEVTEDLETIQMAECSGKISPRWGIELTVKLQPRVSLKIILQTAETLSLISLRNVQVLVNLNYF